ncbi:reverse transcriptase [Trichonephila clavipes]|nr:reverse transcriptase [Trichonephila clavipes]
MGPNAAAMRCPIPKHLERADDVASFLLTTKHYCMRVYFRRLVPATDKGSLLCSNAKIDGNNLHQCTGLDEYPSDDIVSRYCEVRRQMTKKPSTGDG